MPKEVHGAVSLISALRVLHEAGMLSDAPFAPSRLHQGVLMTGKEAVPDEDGMYVSRAWCVSCARPRARRSWMSEAACTCFLGHQDHSQDCGCTTVIAECPVHADSDIGRLERRVIGERDPAPPEG